jgi:nitrogenase molybdenum-iron protein beta chain
MTQTLYADRNGCALHGVIKLLEAIKGVVPILHANSGCSINAHFSANISNGATGRYFRGVLETSATNLYDKHVVFGGTSRLREQIKNTVKVLNGDLYVVATGCVPEIVGDDVPAMVKEARDQHFPVIGITAPGFKGNAYQGYASAVKSFLIGITDLFEINRDVKDNRINLLGLVPEQDPYWEGDLLELENILADVGLEANRLLGLGQDLKDWKNISRARLNLVLSPWGLDAARWLEEHHSIPYLYLGWLPVGSKDVNLLLSKLSAELELDEEIVLAAQNRNEHHSRYFLQKSASAWLEHDLQKQIGVVANSAYAIGLARFLAGTFGQLLQFVVITDEPEDTLRAEQIASIHEVAPGIPIIFSASQEVIAQHIAAADIELVLGSYLERNIAEQRTIPLIEVATPVRESIILHRSYSGVLGALALTESFSQVVIHANHQVAHRKFIPTNVITPQHWHESEKSNLETNVLVINDKAINQN